MSDHGKRLAKLETIYQRSPEPGAVTPFDPSLLTDDETAEREDIFGAMRAVDVGLVPLDHRRDLRARLDALTDEHLDRLEALQRKGWGLPA
ncbi:MAG: hypothetical protein M3Q71_14010 [Chloroflexota bacterium]|nr:hypothetical protein [Chloroflexota bacterium]MDP9471755.1 hypothetical protein [Chloroflexota bacterium]